MEQKICTKCGKSLSIDNFYFRNDNQKFRNACKICTCENVRTNYQKNLPDILERMRIYHEKNKESVAKQKKEHYEKNKDKIIKRIRKYESENKEKVMAQKKIKYYKKRKYIIPPNECQLCERKGKTEAHHPDYSKPLDIIWVCKYCHNRIHHKRKDVA